MKPPTSLLFVIAAVLLLCSSTVAQDHNQPTIVPQSSQAAMQEIVAKLAQKIQKVNCNSPQCTLLVEDFSISSSSTSRGALQLSDEFALLLAQSLPRVRFASRTTLRQFMSVNRIPIGILNEEHATRWLGRELGATTVMAGELDFKKGDTEARFKIFDARPKQKRAESLNLKLPELLIRAEDLQPIEPYEKLDKVFNDDGTAVPSAGKGAVTVPKCSFTPNPSYTDAAREAKFSGYLTVDAIVTSHGTVEVQRVVRGLPFNLNEQARRMLETWKCNPSTKDGIPVSALVMLEVNFRLY